ncbi:DUF5009 domain-containing protein [Terriglobus aquaticus]|uniref:DUF5009 domain-containing protein n=1 Tax=Terriglobus aquaticus TaxID=940139 RepID=A0ABW9KF73_9BACT|nr:DUF5009 domain-containing protein [Terriglobus aquaticus]
MSDLQSRKPERVVSLDIFRGLNIALMIFVNEVAEIRGLPRWTYHAHGYENRMTYVDMVFPAFLLIVGMSLPLAVNSRIRRGDTAPQLVWYVVLRSVALITLGLILANLSSGTAALMHGLPGAVWGLLALLAAVLVWFDYPRDSERKHAQLHAGLRVAGLVMLVVLAALYRKAENGGPVQWLSYSYPEILGLIGYTYLLGALCYMATRRWKWAPAGWFAVFAVYNVLATAKILPTTDKWWIWPVSNGSMETLVFAGVLLTTLFFLSPDLPFRRKAVLACSFGVIAGLAGWLALPLGLSKIRATPSWVLFTIAACCWVYTLLYWLCDVKQIRGWAAPVRSAGSNTLLTYLLPDFWYVLLGVFSIHAWSTLYPTGWGGVVRSLVFTAAMLAISTLLTRMKVRLQL